MRTSKENQNTTKTTVLQARETDIKILLLVHLLQTYLKQLYSRKLNVFKEANLVSYYIYTPCVVMHSKCFTLSYSSPNVYNTVQTY